MTEDSRHPGHNSSFDDEPGQEQRAPVEPPAAAAESAEPEGSFGDGGYGEVGQATPPAPAEPDSGFAPPDTIHDRPMQAPPPGDRLVAGPGGPAPQQQPEPGFIPGFGNPEVQQPEQAYAGVPQGYAPGRPGRPGFAPHDQDPRGQYGWQQNQPPAANYQPGPPAGPRLPGPPPPQFGGQPPNQPPNWAPAPTPPAPNRKPPSGGMLVMIALIVALVAGAVGAGVGVIATDKKDSGPGVVDLGGGKNNNGSKSRPANTVAGVAQRVLPSVVKIQVSLGNGEGGTGTGFLVKDGYILTNNHVVSEVKQGAQMQIVFNDKRTTTGTIVGTDPTSDIAVVKPTNTDGQQGLQLGDSDQLAVGDEVIAIGSPLGLQGSVTTGIVSALNRPIQTSSAEGNGDSSVLNAIQTDAAINPGNSGGPLLNSSGQVIGINTAIASLNSGSGFGQQQESGSIGLGFAIPVNQAKRVAESIINSGGKTPKHAIIGISIDQSYQGNGVRVATSGAQGSAPVTPGGPADKVGIRAGDVITGFDSKPIASAQDLLAAIRAHAPGDKVTITYTRDGKSTTVGLTLGGS